MRTVELFAGIGGFRLAADGLGWRTVWANDLCPRACRVYRERFGGEVLREGDLRDYLAEIPAHDVLTAGFPCQPFSSAGKKKGLRDPRGTLFEAIASLLVRCRPPTFVLENVKRLLTMEGGSHFATILRALTTAGYRVEWRLLNAMDLGLPQNRQRVFLVGKRSDLPAEDPCLVGEGDLPLGFDPATAKGKLIVRHGARFPAWGLAEGRHFIAMNPVRFSAALPRVLLREVLQADVPPEYDFTEATLRWLGANRPVDRLVGGVRILSNQAGGARMGYTIFGIDGVAPTLTSTTSRHYERYRVGDRYRRLTPVEYARIQGFPDDHARAAVPYDRYALYGNAVPPPLARWVLARAAGLEEEENTSPDPSSHVGHPASLPRAGHRGGQSVLPGG